MNNGHQITNLSSRRQHREQVYCSCCNIQMLKDVMPMSTHVEMACTQSLMLHVAEPAVSKGSNDISCFQSSTSGSPPACDGVYEKKNLAAVSNKRRRESSGSNLPDEKVLTLVAQHTKWNPFLLCFLSCVCKKTSAITNRILWREFCLSQAPKMVSDLLLGARDGRIDGGWNALGKLFLYCAGCCHSNKSSRFPVQKIAGHFVPKTRFSRNTGQSFLVRRCRHDVLYMSDPCEHDNGPEDMGVFRGVFRGFDKSETKKLLTNMRAQLEEERCPFCKAGVWSMASAHMIPHSASIRLGAFDENVEYFICLNGHVNGRCSLLQLSDTDASDAEE